MSLENPNLATSGGNVSNDDYLKVMAMLAAEQDRGSTIDRNTKTETPKEPVAPMAQNPLEARLPDDFTVFPSHRLDTAMLIGSLNDIKATLGYTMNPETGEMQIKDKALIQSKSEGENYLTSALAKPLHPTLGRLLVDVLEATGRKDLIIEDELLAAVINDLSKDKHMAEKISSYFGIYNQYNNNCNLLDLQDYNQARALKAEIEQELTNIVRETHPEQELEQIAIIPQISEPTSMPEGLRHELEREAKLPIPDSLITHIEKVVPDLENSERKRLQELKASYAAIIAKYPGQNVADLLDVTENDRKMLYEIGSLIVKEISAIKKAHELLV